MTESFGTGGAGPLHAHDEAMDENAIPPAAVTTPGRITGTLSRPDDPTTGTAVDDDAMWYDEAQVPPRRRVDWPAIISSVVSGLGITVLLIALGSSLGLEIGSSPANQDGSQIVQTLGLWAVVSAIIGAFLGSFIGGRFARFLSRPSVIYHGIASWGLTVVATMILAALGATGLFGSALNAAANVAGDNNQVQSAVTSQARGAAAADAQQPNANADNNAADQAADTSAKVGWAVTVALFLSLAAAIAGWWLGARRRLFAYEREGDVKLLA